MSDHLNHDLSPTQIAGRVLFSLLVTAIVGVGAYIAIGWIIHLRPL